MKRKPSLSAAKKRAWDQFSIYIRTRDCVAYLKTHPELSELCTICVTCPRVYEFKKLQAGHFVAGRTNSILFDERGVNAQCYACNIREHGNTTAYWLWMEENWGRDVIDELMALKQQPLKMKVWDYDEIRDKYKTLTDELIEKATHKG